MHEYSEFKLVTNYIYLYHTDEFLILPVFPDQIADTLNSTFNEQNALSRSAPVFSYSNSGPRTVQVNLKLHRDMLDEVNTNVSNLKVEIGDDYIDTLIKRLQAIALPKYNSENKEVVPPMVAVRFGDDVFIKGVVSGGISIDYMIPVIQTETENKYSQISISFQVKEVDPYDAESIGEVGSFRGLTGQNNIYLED